MRGRRKKAICAATLVHHLGFCGAVPPDWGERRNPYFYFDHFGDLPIFPPIVIMSVIILTVLVLVLVLVVFETRMGFEPRFSSRTQICHGEKPVVASKSCTINLLCRRVQCR